MLRNAVTDERSCRYDEIVEFTATVCHSEEANMEPTRGNAAPVGSHVDHEERGKQTGTLNLEMYTFISMQMCENTPTGR